MSAWFEYSSTTFTYTTTEKSCIGDTVLQSLTDKGTFQIFMNMSALTAGDQYEIKIKDKPTDGSSQLVVYSAIVTGAMMSVWVSPALMLGYGWDVTIQKLAGTDRAIPSSIRWYN